MMNACLENDPARQYYFWRFAGLPLVGLGSFGIQNDGSVKQGSQPQSRTELAPRSRGRAGTLHNPDILTSLKTRCTHFRKKEPAFPGVLAPALRKRRRMQCRRRSQRMPERMALLSKDLRTPRQARPGPCPIAAQMAAADPAFRHLRHENSRLSDRRKTRAVIDNLEGGK